MFVSNQIEKNEEHQALVCALASDRSSKQLHDL